MHLKASSVTRRISALALFLLFLALHLSFTISFCNAYPNFPKECGTAPVVHSNYTPIGRNTLVHGMTVYETGLVSSSRILIAIYDIFGFHPNTKQVADKVAAIGGFRVVMPDFYRGVPWDENNFPPKNWQDLVRWIELHGNWTHSMKNDVTTIINAYRNNSDGTTNEFGMFGFCWGGYISIEAGTELTKYVKAVGLVHPSFVEVPEAAAKIRTPVIVLPSQNEPDYIEFQKTVQGRLVPGSVENVRFDDMMHGFASARGNLSNPILKERVEQVIGLLANFFNRHLPKQSSRNSTAGSTQSQTNSNASGRGGLTALVSCLCFIMSKLWE